MCMPFLLSFFASRKCSLVNYIEYRKCDSFLCIINHSFDFIFFSVLRSMRKWRKRRNSYLNVKIEIACVFLSICELKHGLISLFFFSVLCVYVCAHQINPISMPTWIKSANRNSMNRENLCLLRISKGTQLRYLSALKPFPFFHAHL